MNVIMMSDLIRHAVKKGRGSGKLVKAAELLEIRMYK